MPQDNREQGRPGQAGQDRFRCQECNVNFNSQDELQRHKEQLHEPVSQSPGRPTGEKGSFNR